MKGIGHVINMDLPRAFEDYVHRIGAWRPALGAAWRAAQPVSRRDSVYDACTRVAGESPATPNPCTAGA